MTLVLDAGGLIAIERQHRSVTSLVKEELLAGRVPITHGGVVGQVWRGGSGRQANLSRTLSAIRVVGLDDTLGRRAGNLLRLARRSDVIDAAVVLLAADDDVILTSDADDLVPLAYASGLRVQIVPV